MKRLLLLLLVVLAVGAWVGEKMVQDPGYAMLAYNGTTIETSLWVLIVILVLGFAILHWLINFLLHSKMPHTRIKEWREHRRHSLAQRKTMKGLLALSEGKWWQAQRLLKQSANDAQLPLVNYLAGARAAHEQREDKAADELLQQARSAVPQAEVAIGVSQAQIQLERGEYETCLANLIRLRRLAPKNTYVLRLLKSVYVSLEDWQGLTNLLPDLRKHKVFNPAELDKLEQTCYAQLLGTALANIPAEADVETRLKALNREWDSLPNRMSQDELIVRQYVELLIEARSEEKAESFLRTKIKKEWDEGLVRLYGRVQAPDAHKQLEVAKGWLKKHPDSASLKLTLGRISMRNEHWGKAVDYLEESLALEKSPETYSELTRLLTHLGDNERSLSIMQDGMELMSTDLPPLPLPQSDTIADTESSSAAPEAAPAESKA
ncbi:heme biosynthesis HemY N-terminal domain-containing protein [Neptunomonas phycophila]|uniref:heme biosynthesis HemY N-terminal domain-containing protein n=1 Tax=Neptunomonas phycophila TaxID=1572645 RepID=UPI000949189A|nr:heme biosynthesis HemY N-terminal domain-containing protein [Neptunomonas phycophila]